MLCSEFEVGTSEVIEKAARQLDEFFAGKRKEFDVPLLFVGTDFQKQYGTIAGNTFWKDSFLW